jgi:hypothetical protein
LSEAKCETGWGRTCHPTPPLIAFALIFPLQGRVRAGYAAAVVTPPSTTMVWPVMKVEASEAR